jgi:hypothetical protein
VEINPKTIYCFLDTNALIEFPVFEGVNWLDKLDREVCFVIAPIVHSELDKHKDNSGNVRARNRARSILAKLNPYLEHSARSGDAVPLEGKPGVSVLALFMEPQIDWTKNGLDSGRNDDRLIACMLTFRDTQLPQHLMLLSHDTGPRLKAIGRQIEARDISAFCSSIPNESPDEVEQQRILRENQMLKNRVPKLEFGFFDGNKLAERITVARISARIDTLGISNIRTESDLSNFIAERLVAAQREVARASVNGLPTRDTEAYWDKFNTYLDELRSKFWIHQARFYGYSSTLSFLLKNAGTVAATGIEVVVPFPTGSFVLENSDREDIWDLEEIDEPDIPWKKPAKQPALPWNVQSNIFNTKGIGTFLNPVPPVVTVTKHGWFYDMDDRSYMTYEYPKLLTGQSVVTNPLHVYLPPHLGRGVTIECSIYADALPAPLTQKLHLMIEQE